ncbi:MAG: hypothetical protein NZ805_11055 [Armatimonadetes bacterium]|nr:hypothetical protein [Armatimonadota bacterium]MDW8029316.1 hypothetical protein [Armatimonadota bacterium]
MTEISNRIKALSQQQILILIFILAFAIRFAFLTTKPHAWTHKLQAGDEPIYHGIAVSLARGEGYQFEGKPTARYGPGYPFFIAAVYRTLGISPPAARVGNAFLGAILSVLIALWAVWIWGKKAGLVSGLAAAIYYPFVQLPPYLMTENLYLPLFIAAMMATWRLSSQSSCGSVKSIDDREKLKLFSAGALWGMAALTRSIALPIALLTSFWLLLKTNWRQAGVLSAVFVAVLVPWTVRNYLVFNSFVPIQLSAGHDFYLAFGPSGNEPKVLGHWNWGSDVSRPKIPEGLSPVERDKWLQKQAWEQIKADPMEAVINRIPRKLINLLSPFYGTASLPNKVLTTFFYIALISLAVPSLVRSWRSENRSERNFVELVLLVALFTIVFHAIFYGVVRYRYPIDALLLVAVGQSALRWGKERLSSKEIFSNQ